MRPRQLSAKTRRSSSYGWLDSLSAPLPASAIDLWCIARSVLCVRRCGEGVGEDDRIVAGTRARPGYDGRQDAWECRDYHDGKGRAPDASVVGVNWNTGVSPQPTHNGRTGEKRASSPVRVAMNVFNFETRY